MEFFFLVPLFPGRSLPTTIYCKFTISYCEATMTSSQSTMSSPDKEDCHCCSVFSTLLERGDQETPAIHNKEKTRRLCGLDYPRGISQTLPPELQQSPAHLPSSDGELEGDSMMMEPCSSRSSSTSGSSQVRPKSHVDLLPFSGVQRLVPSLTNKQKVSKVRNRVICFSYCETG